MMMRKFTAPLVFLVTLSLVVLPAFATPGNGHSSSSKASHSDTKANTEKVDKSSDQGSDKGVTQGNDTVEKGKNRLDSLSQAAKDKVQQDFTAREKNSSVKALTDVQGHWAENAIERAQRLGLLSGYADGSFKPNAPVSDTEMMVVAVNLAESLGADPAATDATVDEAAGDTQTVDEGTTTQEDVPAWAEDSAKKADALNIINLNRFHSQVQATRAEAAVMLAKALGLTPVTQEGTAFSDQLLISSEDVGYILALKDAGVVSGFSDGNFNPNSSVTRAEIAAMLSKIADTVEEGDGTTPDGTTTDGTTTDGTTTGGTTTDGTTAGSTTTDSTTTDGTTTGGTTTDGTTTVVQ